MVLEQGDIIEVDFNPSVGHEPAKVRPAIVVSGYLFNSRSSLISVIPLTSSNSGYPLHVPINEKNITGFACVEQLRNMDLAQSGYRVVGYVNDVTMKIIMGFMRGMFDLR